MKKLTTTVYYFYLFGVFLTGVIPKSLPVLLTEPVLRKAAVDRGLRFSTEQYECQLRNDFTKCAESAFLVYISTFYFGSNRF